MKSLHEKALREYKKLKPRSCPVLGNEMVYFYNSGYEHLIRKGRKFRPANEIYRRMKLLAYAEGIIQDKAIFAELRKSGHITFWGLYKRVGKRDVTVVVRRIGNGPKHFFSIMDEKLK
jgi:hypothetical protein